MTNIDFTPSVFDSGNPEPAEPTRSYWKLGLVSFMVLVLVGLGVYVVASMRSAPPSQPEFIRLKNPRASASANIPSRADSDIRADVPDRPSWPARKDDRDCTGDEIICTVATANKPADLLRKLIAAIPTASAKQYRIRLSVTAIDEPAGDNTATDSSTP